MTIGSWVQGRSVVEMMTLVLTMTVCGAIFLAGTAVAIVEIIDPTTDTESVVQALINVISAILGALLGLLAGKAEGDLHRRPNGSQDEL